MQGLAQLLTIFLIFITFIIGLFFIKRHKAIRYVLHSISGLFLAGFIFDPYIKSRSILESERKVIGYYKFDIYNSRFDSTNLKQYSDVMLNVKSDNTFSTTRIIPFLKSQSGRWEIKDNGDFEYLTFKLDNSDFEQEIPTDFPIWTFSSVRLITNNNQNVIVFKR